MEEPGTGIVTKPPRASTAVENTTQTLPWPPSSTTNSQRRIINTVNEQKVFCVRMWPKFKSFYTLKERKNPLDTLLPTGDIANAQYVVDCKDNTQISGLYELIKSLKCNPQNQLAPNRGLLVRQRLDKQEFLASAYDWKGPSTSL